MSRLDTFPKNELILSYRQTFSSRAGIMVLSHMLYELGVFLEVSESAEDMALKNYGTRLLNILAGSNVNESSIEDFIKRLTKQPLKKEDDGA